jgi:squalene-hopene/tetraprenyl-beta-curcumene cyclase
MRTSETSEKDVRRLERALNQATEVLLQSLSPNHYWSGFLSSSALSTATAVTALAILQRNATGKDFRPQMEAGLRWLSDHANEEGGWGDTVASLSNLSTTTLCWAAFGAVEDAAAKFQKTVAKAEQWLKQKAGGISPEVLAPAVIARYGKDRTFSIPILTMCALAGRLGSGREAWKHVIPLPFELAAFPHRFFAALRLPVVSYALPALIAIGQAHHVHSPSRNPILRALRNVSRERTLRKLTEIQPTNGGFLEATPLTSFVVMSLAGSGQPNHPVVQRGVEFLKQSQREDGSWPIDTNLATWVTTLAVNAIGEDVSAVLPAEARRDVCDWLLQQQYREVHPYTHAAPGGWAWTDLPGGVPDADDTSGAVLALKQLGEKESAIKPAAFAGIEWLLGLQNSDGGIPTFCRGWGALPFDRSSADITAHAVRAWLAWREELPDPLKGRVEKAIKRGIAFLGNTQRPDGSWVPLWFGNQHGPDDENPTYGTARVVQALADPKCQDSAAAKRALEQGVDWLIGAQNSNGSWGGFAQGAASIEETALAVEALSEVLVQGTQSEPVRAAVEKGADWLVAQVESGGWLQASPIGFYFAKLWYFEKLYPVILTVGALRSALRLVSPRA